MTLTDWAEKYRPKSLKEVVGNPSATQELEKWANSWTRRIPEKRAVVLAGEPGVGKTSVALSLASDMGWGVVEMNASDTRNAEAIRKVATVGSVTQTFLPTGEFLRAREGGRKLILLDEADNLFGREDFGGIGAITETIGATRQPIILVVNDLYELTRRSSAIKRLTKTIKFQKPHSSAVKTVLKRICDAEGIEAAEDVLEYVAERADGDLRSAINDLQSLGEGRKKITEEDVAALGYRDVRKTVFEALAQIFHHTNVNDARKSISELDESPENLILWVDENMPYEYRDKDDLKRGYHSLSKADILLGRVTRRQHYGLWSYSSDMMSAGVAAARRARYSGGTYRFPLYLAKMARTRGTRGTIGSVCRKLGTYIHTSATLVRNEVLPAFRILFVEDEEFRRHSTLELNLDAKEIAFLLGEPEDSRRVRNLLESLARLRGDEEHRKAFEEFEVGEEQ